MRSPCGGCEFILKGVWYYHPSILTGDMALRDATRLANTFCDNVLQLADNLELDMSEAERAEGLGWITEESTEWPVRREPSEPVE